MTEPYPVTRDEMAELRILDINGVRVPVVVDGRMALVCVSELCRSAARTQQPSRWLATKAARELVTRVSLVKRMPKESLVIYRQGGVLDGTWMYREVAVAYITWLSPGLGEICHSRIMEIIKPKTSL